MAASMQTRLARGAARDAESEWKRHAALCPRCSRLKRDWNSRPCGTGAELKEEAARLRKDARREAELDKAPNPDQEALF